MSFIKYPSITNTDKLRDSTLYTIDDWYVSEKIHGSNFQLRVSKDLDSFKIGSRNNYNNTFHNLNVSILRHIDYFYALVNKLNHFNKSNYDIIFFGEVYGGYHPNQTETIRQKPIQTGVYYSDKINYKLFDIAFVLSDDTLQFYNLNLEFKNNPFFVDYTVYRQTSLQDVITALPKNAPTQIPLEYNLGDYPNNTMEGYVIKSYKYPFSSNRMIFKYINSEYTTRIKRAPKLEIKRDTIISEVAETIINNIDSSRVTSVLSHDQYDKESYRKFMKNVLDDVIQEFNLELMVLSKEDLRAINSKIAAYKDMWKECWSIT